MKKGTGDEMRPAIGSGIVTGDTLDNYWLNFRSPRLQSQKSLRKSSRPSFLLIFEVANYTTSELTSERSREGE